MKGGISGSATDGSHAPRQAWEGKGRRASLESSKNCRRRRSCGREGPPTHGPLFRQLLMGSWATQTPSSASSGSEDLGEGCRVPGEKSIETLGPHGLDI